MQAKQKILTAQRIVKLTTMAEKAIRDIQSNPKRFALSWKGYFAHTPTGNFKWDQDEPGDWIPSMDDDEWVKYAYSTDLSRQDGVETITFMSVDMWGDEETCSSYDSSEKNSRDFILDSATSHCFYSLLKMRLYDLYCAETGEDPLDNIYSHFFIDQKTPDYIREVAGRNLDKEICSLVRDVNKYLKNK